VTEKWSRDFGCGLNGLHAIGHRALVRLAAEPGIVVEQPCTSMTMLLKLPPSHRPSKVCPRPVEYCARNSITHNGSASGQEGCCCSTYWPTCQKAHSCHLLSPPASSRPPDVGWSVTGRRETGLALLRGHHLSGSSDRWTHPHKVIVRTFVNCSKPELSTGEEN
jgi:hypothetical protein